MKKRSELAYLQPSRKQFQIRKSQRGFCKNNSSSNTYRCFVINKEHNCSMKENQNVIRFIFYNIKKLINYEKRLFLLVFYIFI